MAIPTIVGTATGGRQGAGGFTATPPAGSGSLLAVAGFLVGSGVTNPLTPPAGWTLHSSGANPADAAWSRWQVWIGAAGAGASWTLATSGQSHESVAMTVIGLAEADVVVDAAAYTHHGNTDAGSFTGNSPTLTTTVSALVVRAVTGNPWRDGITSAEATYPTGSTLARATLALKVGDWDAVLAAVAAAEQAIPGSTGAAAWTVTPTPNSGGRGVAAPVTHTIALTVTGGETKTSAASIALDLAAASTASKHAATAAPLALDLATGTGPTKTGQAAAALSLLLDLLANGHRSATTTATLDLLLDLDTTPNKTGAAAALLDLVLTLTGEASKHTATTTGLDVLLGADATATKQAAASAGIDLHLTLAASGTGAEHKTASAALGLGLALDAIAGKTAPAGTTIALTLAASGDPAKHAIAHIDLGLLLDTLADAHKTGGATAVLNLALAIAAAHYTPTGPTPPERTIVIARADRTLTITADDRTLTIDRQDRTLQIGAA